MRWSRMCDLSGKSTSLAGQVITEKQRRHDPVLSISGIPPLRR